MRAPLLPLLVLVGCGQVVRPPAPHPSAAPSAGPRARTAASLRGEPARVAIELETARPATRPAVAAPPSAAPALAPVGLLADPAADETDFAAWYRGIPDRELFGTSYRLEAWLAASGDERHPLLAEGQWLREELVRRDREREQVLVAAPRGADHAGRHAGADREELAWRRWSLDRDLRVHRKQIGQQPWVG